MHFNTCRLCGDVDVNRPVFRFGVRHYCHSDCGLAKWGTEFLRKIPLHEVGAIEWRVLDKYPEAYDLALEMTAQFKWARLQAKL